jgi:hypothetical protein
MANPELLATLGIQETGRRYKKKQTNKQTKTNKTKNKKKQNQK